MSPTTNTNLYTHISMIYGACLSLCIIYCLLRYLIGTLRYGFIEYSTKYTLGKKFP